MCGVFAIGILAGRRRWQSDNQCSCCRARPNSPARAARGVANGGFNLDMWGTIVNRDGIVCAVAFTGADRGSEWPEAASSGAEGKHGELVQPADTALSTANLWAARRRRVAVRSTGEQLG